MSDDRWDLDHLMRLRDELDRLVKALDDRTMAELHRRAGLSGKPAEALQDGAGRALRDGYGGGSSGVAVAVSGVADPVLTTVEADAGGDEDQPDTWRQWDDPMVRQAMELFEHLGAAVVHTNEAQRIRRRIEQVAGPLGRAPSLQGECRCCGRVVAGTATDRLKSGYDESCYRAWLDAGKPGSDPQAPGNPRLAWEEERRQFLESGDGRSRRSSAC